MPTSRAREKVDERIAAFAGLAGLNSKVEKEIAATLSSFATTVQNRLDDSGGGSPIALSTSLEAQVERAISQVSRQPTTYSTNGSGATALALANTTTSVNGSSGSPGLPTAQTVLVNEAMSTKANMLAALDSLAPLSTFVDPADIEAYRNIVRAEVLALTTEFKRPDQPRPVRVRVLFGALLGFGYAPDTPPVVAQDQPSGDLAALNYLLGECGPIVPSALSEDQVALQGVVTADADRLFDLWVAFEYPQGGSGPEMWFPHDRKNPYLGGLAAVKYGGCYEYLFKQFLNRPGVAGALGGFANLKQDDPPYTFSERMIRADLLLPVLAHDSQQVAGALDAVGFGPGAQSTMPIPYLKTRSDKDLVGGAAKRLKILQARQTDLAFGLTVNDLLDWASDLAGGAGYELLRKSGQLGLDLLADQADELYWIVMRLLCKPPQQLPELRDVQVQIELRSLARDLSGLADLSN